MNVPSTPPVVSATQCTTSLATGVRSQVAFVRALLDEVERAAPSLRPAMGGQLADELERLGHECLAAAAAFNTEGPRRAQ